MSKRIHIKAPRSRAERLTVTLASAAAIGALAYGAASQASEPVKAEPTVEYVPHGDATTIKVKQGDGEMDLALRIQKKAGHEYDSLRDAMNDLDFQGTLHELEARYANELPQPGERVPAHTDFTVKH